MAASDFGVSIGQMGWALSAFVLAMGASSLPAGLLGDRWGTGRLLTLYYWLLAATALACMGAESFTAFLIAHGLLGFAAGCFHPAALGLVSLVTPSARLGKAMGWFGVWGSVGTAFAPLAMGSAFGWRAGFGMLSATALAGALACHVGLARGWLPVGRQDAADERALQRDPAQGRSLLMLLLVVMSVNAFLSTGWEAVFPQTIDDQGITVIRPWVIATFILVVGGFGQYIGGILARDAYATSRFAVILVVQCLVLLGTAMAIDRQLLPFAFLASFAFFNYGTQPIENRLLAAHTSTRRRATAYALKFVVALLVAAPAPLIVTTMYESGGSAPVYRMLSTLAMVAVFFGYLLLRGERRKAQRRPG